MPDFRDIVGDIGSPEELADLREVHDLLSQASRPPEASERPLLGRPRRFSPPRRSWAIGGLGLAAAAAISAAVGFSVGQTNHPATSFKAGSTRPMHGVGPASAASAVIRIGKIDPSGNLPVRMMVRHLPAAPAGGWYALYLTEDDRPAVECGIFQTGPAGEARVIMNAPSDLEEYDGWIVTTLVGGHPARVLLKTGA